MESVLLATTCYEHVVKFTMYVVRALIVCIYKQQVNKLIIINDTYASPGSSCFCR